MSLNPRVANILAQITQGESGIGDLLNGPTPAAGTIPSNITNANIPENDNPRGIWQVLAQLARQRGVGSAEKLALANSNQDRQMKIDEAKRVTENSNIENKYKQALMARMDQTNQREDRNDLQGQAERKYKLLEGAPGTPQPTGGTVNALQGTDQYMHSAITPEMKNQNPEVDLGQGVKLRPPTAQDLTNQAVAKKKLENEGADIKLGPNDKLIRDGKEYTNPVTKESSVEDRVLNAIMSSNNPALIAAYKQIKEMNRAPQDPETVALRKALLQATLDNKNNQNASLSPEKIDHVANLVMNGFPLALVPGMGGVNSQRARVIDVLAERGVTDPNLAKQITQLQQDYIYFSSPSSQGRLRSMDAVTNTGEVLKDKANALGGTDFVAVNQAILAGRLQFNDPKAIAYYNVLHDYASELAQTFGINPTDAKTAVAQSMVNKGYSPEGIAAAVDSSAEAIFARRKAFAAPTGQPLATPATPNGGKPIIKGNMIEFPDGHSMPIPPGFKIKPKGQ